MINFETIIGVEVHAELNTKRKIFSPALNDINAKPNTNIHPIDLALPGTLPQFNEEVLEKALIICRGLNMEITKEMHWDRKNYFYHDNPKGYQITQFDTPIGRNGYILLDNGQKIEIDFMHMEEDTAKTFNENNKIKLDYNRCGVPLVEIVSKPVLKSGKETREYLEKLREILVYLDVCDGKLEEGSFRIDVNISIRPKGTEELRTKVEIKNLNSFTNVEKSINQEVSNQIREFNLGIATQQATKKFDEQNNKVLTMRLKEGASDYRYFPEPDLPLLIIDDEYIAEKTKNIPMLPQEIRKELVSNLNISKKEVEILLQNKDMTDFYLQTLKYKELDPKQTLNYLLVNVNEYLNKENTIFINTNLTVDNLLDIHELIDTGKISSNHVKKIIPLILAEAKDLKKLVKELGIEQISDPKKIQELVLTVIEQEKDSVESYINGKDRAFGFMIGKIIGNSKGQANPKLVNQILKEELDNLRK